MANDFQFYSVLAGWSTWQWVFLNFSKNFWSFDTPYTPRCASTVLAENEIWNRLKQFLPVWRSTIYFSNSRSLEQPGLIIESLEYIARKVDFTITQFLNYLSKARIETGSEKNEIPFNLLALLLRWAVNNPNCIIRLFKREMFESHLN